MDIPWSSVPMNTTTHRGFTLIELLVVMSIIALLIGVLLPALSQARRQGREVQCLSQLRQIGIGQHAYAMDARDYYLPGYAAEEFSDFYENSWYRTLSKYTKGTQDLLDCPISSPRHVGDYGMDEIVPGFEELTWSDINYGMPLYSLTSDRSDGAAMGLSFGRVSTSYDMSPARTDMVKRPDFFVMAGDTNNVGINTVYSTYVRRVGFHGCYFTQCQNSAHANLADGDEMNPPNQARNQWIFADGHAKGLTYAEVLATKGLLFRREGR